MDELKDVLKKIEDAINSQSDRIESIEKKLDEKAVPLIDFDIDVEKKGAKFSKATLDKLKALHGALGSILSAGGDSDGDGGDNKDVSKAEIISAIQKGINGVINPPKDDKADVNEQTANIVKAVLSALNKE